MDDDGIGAGEEGCAVDLDKDKKKKSKEDECSDKDKGKGQSQGKGQGKGGACNVVPAVKGAMRDKLLKHVSDPKPFSGNKVTVVGSGQVGMACALGLVMQNVTNELALYDANADKCRGEVLDLQQGSVFLRNAQISGGGDIACTANSRVIVVTAGARQAVGQSRLDLLQKNVEIFKDMIPKLVKASPKAILLIVTNPVDVMTYTAWKMSGLPKHRVFGSGTTLDSARFRVFMAQKLGVAPASVHGWVLGEHGDSSVPIWSGVNVAGVRLRDLNPKLGCEDDPEKWENVHKEVVGSAYEVIKLKGYTSSAIGLTVSDIVRHILRNDKAVIPLSTHATGYHKMEFDVFLSLPCVVGEGGIISVVEQRISEGENDRLCKSAGIIYEVLQTVKHGL